jgi:MOSC domain-containing protein YiiM
VRTLRALFSALPQVGRVEWIGVRPERHAPVVPVQAVEASVGTGLRGDRYESGGKRQVTLIQAEHLAAVGSLLGASAPVEPGVLRRNIAVSGINLLALKAARFRVGEALLEGTGPCEPCSRMEDSLGPGGYNAMRGHGGITARVIEGGWIKVGDAVEFVSLDGEKRQTELFPS